MTASYTMPLHRRFQARVRSHRIDPSKINVVVPVYNDWEGLRTTLDSLNQMVHKPKRVNVVNDNEAGEIPSWLDDYSNVEVINYEGNRGPAYARNAGFGLRQGAKAVRVGQSEESLIYRGIKMEHDPRLRKTFLARAQGVPNKFCHEDDCNWYYFTDCGCTHDPNLFQHFAMAREREGDALIAVCGSTEGVGEGLINQYMTHQGILNPPLEEFIYGKKVAQSIITCNVLVYGLAFSYLKGFDTAFSEAAGEDLDMGIRLREIGMIGYEPRARVRHKFEESFDDFKSRFERYGRGIRRLEVKHNLSSLRPVSITADQPNLQELADLQCSHMQKGYDSVADGEELGVLTEPICSDTRGFRASLQGLGEDPYKDPPVEPGPDGHCII